MNGLLIAAGVAIILAVFWDAFETLILPRRVSRRIRLARMLYRWTWRAWRAIARGIRQAQRRESFLSYYGPLSFLFLLGVWAFGMILGFAVVFEASRVGPGGSHGFLTLLYLSAGSFFTLGLGDVTPASSLARATTVVEAGTGLTFLALVIAYLPVLYQAFSRREVRISLLDQRAGSPPSAGELLGRRGAVWQESGAMQLRDWEVWAAELLESHLSYPLLALFRSQHDNQSWVAALTVTLDACALIITGVDGISDTQARLTFAMARHAAVDLASTLGFAPLPPDPDRLPPDDLLRLRDLLAQRGLVPASGDDADAVLAELRESYEPYVNGLARRLLMPLPSWLPLDGAADNWEVTAWEVRSGRRARRDVIGN